MKKFVLSARFPEFFIRAVSVLTLLCLCVALACVNRYTYSGGYGFFVAARELIFSAAGTASIGLAAYYCFKKR